MAIPEELIDQVQERTDIVEVISKYVPLKRAGRNYKAPCPFHNEKTPSFIVSPDKKIFHCFGCGAGGNVFSFLMKRENLQFPEAVEILADKAGVKLPKGGMRGKDENSLAERLYKINESACQAFEQGLVHNKLALDYLSSRGIGLEAIKRFRIGYAPEAWESLLSFFKKKGIDAPLLEKAGIVISNDKGGYYDRFRNRITFPITDLRDRVLGFGARVLDSSLPKYINSPETVVYSKGRNLYGLNISREDIKKEGFALVVEGYLDFIIPYQAGARNIIATLGTALTVDQVKLLKRFTNTAIIVYDPDDAGQAASLRNLELFVSEDVNVYITELPSGFDPDGYIRKFGADEFSKLVKTSRNIFEYKFAKLSKQYDIKTAHGKASIAGGMLPTIAKIGNAVFKADLLKKLADRLGVDEGSVRQELGKVKQDYSRAGSGEPAAAVSKKKDYARAEITVLSLLFAGGDILSKMSESLLPEELRNSSVRDVFTAAFMLHREGKEVTPSVLINRLGTAGEAAAIISEAANILDTLADKEKALGDCISRIKQDNTKDRLLRIQEAIKIAHAQKEENRVKELVAEYNGLVKPVK